MVPKGWAAVQLGDIASESKVRLDPTGGPQDLPYVGLEHLIPGSTSIPWVGRAGDVGSLKTSFAPGDILFGKLRPYLKKVAMADIQGVCSTDILAIRPIRSKVVPSFLLGCLAADSAIDFAVSTSAGTKMPRTSWHSFSSFPVLLPPLPEQGRIAEILTSVDESTQATEAVIEQTKRVKQGLLARLLTRGIGHSRFQKTSGGRIPGIWKVRPLGEVAKVQTGIAKGGRQIKEPEELPYLRVANVQDGFIDLSEVKTIVVSARDVQRFLLQKGDVLLTEGGDLDKLGRGAVWGGYVAPCLHQNHIFAVRPNPTVLLPEFLAAQTGSAYGKRYFLGAAKQTTNLASINSSQLKAFPTLVPPLKEQEQIVEILASIEGAIEAQTKDLQSHVTLKRGLLSDLLSGRVRVKVPRE